MYEKPSLEAVGTASTLIQGSNGNPNDTDTSHTKSMFSSRLEEE